MPEYAHVKKTVERPPVKKIFDLTQNLNQTIII